MPEQSSTANSSRRLSAIMFVDIVGYTALMQKDEAMASTLLRRFQKEIHSKVNEFKGTIANEMGDGMLCVFDAPNDAVRCAMALKNSFENEPEVPVRLGIHSGTVVFEDGKVYGDSVNVASRIESMGVVGAVLITDSVRRNIKNQADLQVASLGKFKFKNVDELMEVYAISNDGFVVPNRKELKGKFEKNSKTFNAWYLLVAIISILLLFQLWDRKDSANQESRGLGVDLPSGPKIAVLPFRNLSNDQDQKYFSDGLTEDIITALSRTDLFVQGFSPNLQTVADKSIVDVGKDLNVRYLLKGSVRRDLNNIRVSAQLFDTKSGGQIWGESYSRDLTVSDIFAVQDDITIRVVATIADASGIIARKSIEEIARNPTADLAAYECVLRSYAYEGLHTAEAHLEARECIERSIKMDSTYADLLGIAAYLYREEHYHDFNQRPGALENAMKLAKQAIKIDPRNQNGYYALAFIYADLGVSRMDDFYKAATRTIQLNPNNSRVGGLGVLIAFGGEWEWGIDLLEKTLNINPYSHLKGWMHFTKAVNHFRLSQYLKAKEEINESSFSFPVAYIVSIGIHVNLDRQGDAIALLNEAIIGNPEFLVTAQEQLEQFFQGADDLHEKLMLALEKALSWSQKD